MGTPSRGRKPPIDPVRRVVPTGGPMPEPTHPFPAAELIELPGHGPEDVVLDARGRILTGLEDGRILRVDPASRGIDVVANTHGRPLGLEILDDGRVLVCDSHRGLLRLDPDAGNLETLVTEVAGKPLMFCSNATAAADGTIWFTESTTRFHFEHYRAALLEHRPSGRLLRRDPNGEVEVVVDELYFANGVSLTPDQSALLFAETGAYQISRIPLTGPRAGQRDVVLANLPGFPDNMSRFAGGRAWVAMTNPRNKLLDASGRWPGVVRKQLWALPDRLIPPPERIVWAIAIDPDGNLVADLHTKRSDYHMVTAVAESGSALYFAGIERAALLRADLP